MSAAQIEEVSRSSMAKRAAERRACAVSTDHSQWVRASLVDADMNAVARLCQRVLGAEFVGNDDDVGTVSFTIGASTQADIRHLLVTELRRQGIEIVQQPNASLLLVRRAPTAE